MDKKLRKHLQQTGRIFLEEMADHLQSYITEEKREFPRTTIRKKGKGITGKIATSPRDVVDTGDLRDSFSKEITTNQNSVEITAKWTADHAELVYAGHKNIPPYPWVEIGLRDKKIDQKMINEAWEKAQNKA